MTKKLGVNIDHVATLREQRKAGDPNLVQAAQMALSAGADIITVHLREDRRHIQDQDLWDLAAITDQLNVEVSVSPDMVGLVIQLAPKAVCLVPENREELTTEGGLDLSTHFDKIQEAIDRLHHASIPVSLFIEPGLASIQLAKQLGADTVELHTGAYSNLSGLERISELGRLRRAALEAHCLGLQVNAGHGLNFENVQPIVDIPEIVELHIGHSLISQAIFMGLDQAVIKMKGLI